MKWDGKIGLALATAASLFSAAGPPSAKESAAENEPKDEKAVEKAEQGRSKANPATVAGLAIQIRRKCVLRDFLLWRSLKRRRARQRNRASGLRCLRRGDRGPCLIGVRRWKRGSKKNHAPTTKRKLRKSLGMASPGYETGALRETEYSLIKPGGLRRLFIRGQNYFLVFPNLPTFPHWQLGQNFLGAKQETAYYGSSS